ncbi:MAG: hypothetical protein R3B49_07635 [Phycisphaerales bacterium]
MPAATSGDALPGSSIGGLMRPGIDQVLGGLGSLSTNHRLRLHGVMAPKRAANSCAHADTTRRCC